MGLNLRLSPLSPALGPSPASLLTDNSRFFRHYYGRRPVTWVVFSALLVIVVIIVVTVSIRYTSSDYTDDDGLHYAATDTRIIPVSGSLCEGLRLTVNKAQDGYTASLSVLNSRPKLNGSETFAFSGNYFLGYNYYEYDYFYMYPGSKFTVSACISSGNTHATFKMIKGNSKFKSWIEDPFYVKDSFQINAPCASGNNSHTYSVTKKDYYYLIFDADQGSSAQLSYSASFYRTRYDVGNNASTTDFCSTETDMQGKSCSVSVPLSGKTVFLEVAPQSGTEIDWADGVGLDTKCVPRVWIYVVIAFSILIGLVAILTPLLACIIIKLRKKNKTRSSVNTTNTTASATVVADTAPLIAPPPSHQPRLPAATTTTRLWKQLHSTT